MAWKFGVAFALAVLVGGCASRQDVLARYSQNCASYGMAKGSPEHAQCMMQQDLQQKRTRAAFIASTMADRPPVQCQSSRVGGTVQTNCQ